jgi:hypothetical protein
VAALDVLVTGADVVVVVESVDADADADCDDEAEDEDDEDSDDELGARVVDGVAGVAAEWAVVSVATRIPSPTAENAAAAPTTRVTRRTRATARSRDRTPGGVAARGGVRWWW